MKRRRHGELLAHEEHRKIRREHQDRHRKPLLRGPDQTREPRAGACVRDLVVVLVEDNEPTAWVESRRGPVTTPAKTGIAAVVYVPLHNRLTQILDPPEVAQVTAARPGENRVERMMKIIAPLRVESITADVGRVDDACVVQVAFRDEICRTAKRA